MENNLTDALIKYTIQKKSEITNTVIKKAKQCIIDYIGVVYAGAKVNRDVLNKEMLKDNCGKCSVHGFAVKTDMKTAALINAFNAHTIELDDGHRMGMIHLGAVIISAVMAAAEQYGIDKDNVLKGIIMGYEAAVRTAIAIQPMHKKAGFHTTGTCGCIGAAIGIGVARDCRVEQLKSILSVAATSAAGLLQIQEDNSELKPYNAAHAAMAGVAASQFGATALHGPDDILSGERGMLRLMGGSINQEAMIDESDYFEIERIYVKPYAACRHCHSAMEAAIVLRNEYDIAPKHIEKMNIYTYGLAIKGHSHKEIKGIGSAKLSMPYSVAASYILGIGGLEAYTVTNIAREDIMQLVDKISIYEKEEFNGRKNGQRIAEVSIIKDNGHVVTKRIDYAKGDPENPMSIDDIKEKFIKLMIWSEAEDKIKKIWNTYMED